jgi:glycosyltransferase involved in cell wall biosynthesis
VKKISVVVNTLNEERNLPRALASVENWADEIVVVDMRSDDATVEIATKHGARVFGHERTGYVEPARNFAIDKASCDWILILDADEEVPRTLASILVKEVRNPRADYYRLPRRNIVFGKWLKHSRWWPDYNIRFFKKGSVSWNEVIHSVPMTKGEGADLDPSKEYALIHHHYESVEQFISRLNRYTTEHSRVLIRRGYKFDWHDIIVKPVGEFLSRYFFGEGYKDGLHGLVLSGLQGFSEFVLYLKVWQSEKFETRDLKIREVIAQMKRTERELHYWQADVLYKRYGGLINKIKRKLKI